MVFKLMYSIFILVLNFKSVDNLCHSGYLIRLNLILKDGFDFLKTLFIASIIFISDHYSSFSHFECEITLVVSFCLYTPSFMAFAFLLQFFTLI